MWVSSADDAVDLGKEQDVGTPGVQDGEEADLGVEALRIGCDFE
ncbi:MAG TPA: hypothetical protein VMR02_08075 [Terracidiphilus sp.]|jgi:hypothetical protein|nr:hypothetical protein [Terracidiphilus sp.]